MCKFAIHDDFDGFPEGSLRNQDPLYDILKARCERRVCFEDAAVIAHEAPLDLLVAAPKFSTSL